MSDVIKVYSNALFQLSVEENLLEEVHTDLVQISTIFKSQDEFLKILSSPIVDTAEKISMLKAVFQNGCNELVFNFMCLLSEKNRMDLFCEIQQDFSNQYNKINNVLRVEVITCIPLTEELRKGIVSKLAKKTGKNINIVETIDKSILGGIILKYDNTVIDDSIKSRFKDLSKQLHKH
ncbi:MAG: ATP synthase F1 subunit delta [Oscillospiraceae bacterium]